MRPELKEFAMSMERILQQHDEKKSDSWRDCDLEFLFYKLDSEIKEWHQTVPQFNDYSDNLDWIDELEITKMDAERLELVDIANVCMMLFHRLNADATPTSPTLKSGKGEDGLETRDTLFIFWQKCQMELQYAKRRFDEVKKDTDKAYWEGRIECCKKINKILNELVDQSSQSAARPLHQQVRVAMVRVRRDENRRRSTRRLARSRSVGEPRLGVGD